MSASRSRKLTLPSPISLSDLWSARVGTETPRDLWVDQQSAARILREQTQDLAERLERQGVICRDTSRILHVVGLVTGDVEEMTAWRNINLLPLVQSRNTRSMLTALAYWMDLVPSNQRRMIVVSAGWVPLARYRDEHQALGRQISRLAADPVLREARVEIVYRNVENTAKRDEHGVPMLNLHSHMIVRSRRYLGPKRWKELMDYIRSRFPKEYAHDSKIEQPKEAVKYAFKPAELQSLSDQELSHLARQCHGLRFYVPMGELRALRQQLEPAETVDPDTGEVSRRPGLKLVRVKINDRDTWRVTERQAVKHPEPDPDRTPVAPRDIVLAITPPQPRFSPKAQPCLVVMNYGGDHTRLIESRRLSHLRLFAAGLFYQGHYDDNCPKQPPPPLPYPAVVPAIGPPPKPPPGAEPPPSPFFVP